MNERSGIKQAVERLLRRLPALEPVGFIVLAIGAALLLGVIKTAEAVFANETQAFDRWMLTALRNPSDPADPVGPAWVEEMARDVSALGGFTWIAFATLAIAIYLWIDHKGRMALLLLASTGSGAVVSM